MTRRERGLIEALQRAVLLPGHPDKGAVRALAALAPDAALNHRQAAALERLAKRYRRQIPAEAWQVAPMKWQPSGG